MNAASMGSQQQPGNYTQASYDARGYNTRDFPNQAPTHYEEQASGGHGGMTGAASHRQDFSNTQYNATQQGPGGPSPNIQRQINEGGSENIRDLPVRERPRVNPATGAKPSQRTCMSCNQPLTGQFVRAIGGTFHLECFRCRVSLELCESSVWNT